MPLAFLMAAVWLAVPPSAVPSSGPAGGPQAAPAPVAVSAQIGFGGIPVLDAWLPATMTLRSETEADVMVEVAAARRRASGWHRVRASVHLPAGVRVRLIMPIVIYDLRLPVRVRVVDPSGEVGAQDVPIATTRAVDAVVLALTRRPLGLERLLPERGRLGAAYIEEEDLPPRWQLYEGVRALLVRDLSDRRLLPGSARALGEWVEAGGHLIVVDVPGADALPSDTVRAIIGPTLPFAAAGGPRVLRRGHGEITIVASDPFHPDLPPADETVWRRLLVRPPAPPLADASLLDLLPQSLAPRRDVQILAIAVLAVYLAVMRPLLRWPWRGAGGAALALAALALATAAGLAVGLVLRGQLAGIAQAAIAETAPAENATIARVVTMARIVTRRGEPFATWATPETLPRPLGPGDTVVTLDGRSRLEGVPAERTLPVRVSALMPLDIRGRLQAKEEARVEINNASGLVLRDALVFLNGRVQSLPPIGASLQVSLSPLAWRSPPALDAPGSPEARVLAWTLGRLGAGAILRSTAYLVAWVSDDRGVLHRDRRSTQLLVVVPLEAVR